MEKKILCSSKFKGDVLTLETQHYLSSVWSIIGPLLLYSDDFRDIEIKIQGDAIGWLYLNN
jgi:hypothetical protein